MLELLRKIGYVPTHCVWELTLACDLRCLHCGSLAGRARDDELSLAECLGVADQLVAIGCRKVSLSGGEPTLLRGWEEIGSRLARGGVRVNIISNGWSWSEEQVARAKRARLENVTFSLDGLAEAHDRVRQRPGSFERAFRAIDSCVDSGVPVGVVTHVNQINRESLPELRALLEACGVSFWQLQLGVAEGRLGDASDLALAPSDLLWLVPALADLRRAEGATRVLVAENIGYFGRYERAIRDEGTRVPFYIGCRAGCRVLGIESGGDVKGCLSLPSTRHGEDAFVEGNLREETLQQIWSRSGAFSYNRDFDTAQLGGFCAVCRYGDICRGGCSWTARSRGAGCHDNEYCFYRQAMLSRRFDLVDEPPTEEERSAIDAAAEVATGSDARW